MQFMERLDIPNCPPETRDRLSHLIDLAAVSEKFILPDGGFLYDDKEFKALDDSIELHLPFPYIALEYPHTVHNGNHKTIVFARERDNHIVVDRAITNAANGTWRPYLEYKIPRINYLDRSRFVGDHVGMKIVSPTHDDHDIAFASEVCVLLNMLNVLQCKNVHIERSDQRKPGKVKSAFPFDSYHILTIDQRSSLPIGRHSPHRSPREHLRRGHIRTLSDARRIWVNATVVASGRGSGTVTKDYAIAP